VAHIITAGSAAHWKAEPALLADVAAQLRTYSDSYLASCSRGRSTTPSPGRTPDPRGSLLQFWADTDAIRAALGVGRASLRHDDQVFLSEDLWAGVLEFGIRCTPATSSRRSASIRCTDQFGDDVQFLSGGDEDLTDFRCRTGTSSKERQNGARSTASAPTSHLAVSMTRSSRPLSWAGGTSA